MKKLNLKDEESKINAELTMVDQARISYFIQAADNRLLQQIKDM